MGLAMDGEFRGISNPAPSSINWSVYTSLRLVCPWKHDGNMRQETSWKFRTPQKCLKFQKSFLLKVTAQAQLIIAGFEGKSHDKRKPQFCTFQTNATRNLLNQCLGFSYFYANNFQRKSDDRKQQQQQPRRNDKWYVSAVLWRLFTSQPPQNDADFIIFAGCLKISQWSRPVLPRPGQALSWHLRPVTTEWQPQGTVTSVTTYSQ